MEQTTSKREVTIDMKGEYVCVSTRYSLLVGTKVYCWDNII